MELLNKITVSALLIREPIRSALEHMAVAISLCSELQEMVLFPVKSMISKSQVKHRGLMGTSLINPVLHGTISPPRARNQRSGHFTRTTKGTKITHRITI